MSDIVITVTGVRETALWILDKMARVTADIRAYAQGVQMPLEQTLRATIQHVVYDAYQPTEYRRRADQPLVEAVSSEMTETLTPDGAVIALDFYNDPNRVTLRDDPISAGGSHKRAVPLEIEEGLYPSGRGGKGWQGFTAPRPAYMLFGRAVTPQIHAAVLNIVAKALR